MKRKMDAVFGKMSYYFPWENYEIAAIISLNIGLYDLKFIIFQGYKSVIVILNFLVLLPSLFQQNYA